MEIAALMKVKIADYLQGKEGRTLRMLASRSGVGHSTLWKISQGNTKPTFSHALAILLHCVGPEEAQQILETHFPEDAKKAAKLYGMLRPCLPHDDFHEILSSPMANHLFSIAATRFGLTEDYARSLYGEAGAECVRDLEESEVIARDAQGRLLARTRVYSTLPADAVTSLTSRLSLVKPEHFGTPNAFLGMSTESVTEEAQARIKELLAATHSRILEILRDPANDGAKSIFVGLTLGLLGEQPAMLNGKGA